MGFDVKAFKNEQFGPRTSDVPVSGLAIWFADGEDPVITVRGLTFEELCKADNAADNSDQMLKLINQLQSKQGKEAAESIKDSFGVGEETPANMIRRKCHLIMGSVEPEIDEEMAIKLASTYPVEFKELTNKIVLLTGAGFVPGKRKGSTVNQASD